MAQRILFLGCSSIAVRRAIPALRSLDPAIQLDVASHSGKSASVTHALSEVYNDYAEALRRSPAEVVYISLHNAAHYGWTINSLESGRHVVVDKPAFLTLPETERALDLAAKAGRCIAEATTFECHSQFLQIEHFLRTYGPLNCASAQFNVPPLPIDNFRNYAERGGGCLADMGPYAAAVVRRFGSQNCTYLGAVSGRKHPETGVDVGFSMLAGFADGLRISGDFGFEGEYVNRISFLAKEATLIINRIFSPPPDQAPEWQINVGNESKTEAAQPDDAFRSFFARFQASIDTGAYSPFAHKLFADARFRHALRLQIETM